MRRRPATGGTLRAVGEPSGLTPAAKGVYALGELTLNTALASMSLIYASYFLTQVAGLRPALAGLVPLVGRVLDAFTDPLMGRISDRTRWRAGRRRPYLLIGALPFGAGFAMMWLDPGVASQAARFAYYAAAYCLLTTAMTVLAIPYLALVAEMALGYDERTSLSTYRNLGGVLGILAAVAVRPLAEALGGGAQGARRAVGPPPKPGPLDEGRPPPPSSRAELALTATGRVG